MRQESVQAQPSVAHSPSKAITAYYDQTWIDYRLLWLNRNNLAIHFGYRDNTASRHADTLCNTNRILANRAAIGVGQRVLDAGCGVGGSSFWLAQNRGASVVGITPVESQLLQAERAAAARGLSGCTVFVCADYTDTPFPDSSFDVVWALESVCHAPDKSLFYREAARLLCPGGRLVMAEYLRTDRPLPDPDERLLHGWLDGWAIPDLDSASAHREHANAAGLTEVMIEDVTAHMRSSLQRLYRLALVSYPAAVILRWLGVRSASQHGNVLGALRQYQALERGLWFYGILSAVKPGQRPPAG